MFDQYLDETGQFSEDLFWEEKVLWANHGDRSPEGFHCIRNAHHHFVAEPGIFPPTGFMGHGGARMRWVGSDGVVYESNDVWAQGEIPERFRDQLPDNAEWVPGWWCGGCREYHTESQCPVWLARLRGRGE